MNHEHTDDPIVVADEVQRLVAEAVEAGHEINVVDARNDVAAARRLAGHGPVDVEDLERAADELRARSAAALSIAERYEPGTLLERRLDRIAVRSTPPAAPLAR